MPARTNHLLCSRSAAKSGDLARVDAAASRPRGEIRELLGCTSATPSVVQPAAGFFIASSTDARPASHMLPAATERALTIPAASRMGAVGSITPRAASAGTRQGASPERGDAAGAVRNFSHSAAGIMRTAASGHREACCCRGLRHTHGSSSCAPCRRHPRRGTSYTRLAPAHSSPLTLCSTRAHSASGRGAAIFTH